jgi:hypothetical protein
VSDVKETIRLALQDAVEWQLSLAGAWHSGSPERAEALAQAKAYRKILKRRYGTDKTLMDEMLEGTEVVTLADLQNSTLSK